MKLIKFVLIAIVLVLSTTSASAQESRMETFYDTETALDWIRENGPEVRDLSSSRYWDVSFTALDEDAGGGVEVTVFGTDIQRSGETTICGNTYYGAYPSTSNIVAREVQVVATLEAYEAMGYTCVCDVTITNTGGGEFPPKQDCTTITASMETETCPCDL